MFILDMITLTDNVEDSDIQQFADNFFANPHVLKLGKWFIFVVISFLHKLKYRKQIVNVEYHRVVFN